MITVRDLTVTFKRGGRRVTAVDGVTFGFGRGMAFGLVGGSGSGKTTVLRVLAGLNQGWTGRVEIDRVPQALRRPAGFYRQVQMVFQDPQGSLHPKYTVAATLRAVARCQGLARIDRLILQALDDVGLPASVAGRYPHALSGGQQQRVALARALITDPDLLLLDEPTSALDVSSQAALLALLERLQRERGLTYLLVSHDLAVVAELCQWAGVMQAGKMVEIERLDQLVRHGGHHPYTRRLLQAARGESADGADPAAQAIGG